MYSLTGTFTTAHGSRYLQQLCKHFAHKIDVSFEPEWGCLQFPFGRVELRADQSHLFVSCDTGDRDAADRCRAVVDSHLERFAFREAFTTMDWVLSGPDA
ncbi:DUF2218 domain-containing protein [Tropicimonas sp.]|uniref:DUF2218 domain-containing protein n=1 Tax=Tropicimonas sp. TaxID=2067044 RepID=UPI003A864472